MRPSSVEQCKGVAGYANPFSEHTLFGNKSTIGRDRRRRKNGWSPHEDTVFRSLKTNQDSLPRPCFFCSTRPILPPPTPLAVTEQQIPVTRKPYTKREIKLTEQEPVQADSEAFCNALQTLRRQLAAMKGTPLFEEAMALVTTAVKFSEESLAPSA